VERSIAVNLLVLSDLHLEFADLQLPAADVDVAILAGDIHLGAKALRWIARELPDRPVVYVPGNHEYYGHAIPKLRDELTSAAADTQVRVLDCGEAIIGGVRFLACTLWTDFEMHGNRVVSMLEAQERMTDFRRIRRSPSFRRITPADTVGWHRAARRWLSDRFQSGASDRTVVVSHHAPSAKSIIEDHRLDALAPAYASNADELVMASGAALWVHGHTHAAADYTIGSTRVVSNPRGYPDEPVVDFDPALIIEL
jgi:predicted phosphodiesterase